MKKILVDTDVLIDYLRGYSKAIHFIEQNINLLSISVITVAELYSGVREGKERIILDEFIECFDIISLDSKIAEKGGLIRRDFYKSHGIGLADALIAATVLQAKTSFVTLNVRHYPMLKDVLVPYNKE